jgi:hypothetical protein
MDYRCCNCDEGFATFKEIIDHNISVHASEELRYAFIVLDENTGKKKLSTKSFGITPKECREKNDKIIVTCDNKVRIEPVSDAQNVESTTHKPECKEGQKPPQKPIKEEISNEKRRSEVRHFVDNIAEEAAQVLGEHGLLYDWINFHKMILKGTFPLDNIALRLFLDVVRYYSCSDKHSMRYSDQVCQFWNTGHRLFHGKFLRFMSGQTIEDTVEEEQTTRQISVNFAVPDIHVIAKKSASRSRRLLRMRD